MTTGGESQGATKRRSDEATKGSPQKLSPRWVRVIVYLVLIVLAVGAIRVIDRHVMKNATVMIE